MHHLCMSTEFDKEYNICKYIQKPFVQYYLKYSHQLSIRAWIPLLYPQYLLLLGRVSQY